MNQCRQKSRQLVREFINEALYDPHNGYFVHNTNIFSLDSPLKFNSFLDIDDYQTKLSQLYKGKSLSKEYYQLWHTPSELFRPFYAEAVGNYILSKYKSKDSLIIYEIGPGNGTLCEGIISCLQRRKVDYEYHLVEISSHLHKKQKDRFAMNPRVFPSLGSFLDFRKVEDRECIVIAMEVLDNLSQDITAYSKDGELMQGIVETDDAARFYDMPGRYNVGFEPVRDKLIIETVNSMDEVGFQWEGLKWSPRDLFEFLGYCQSYKWQYIPTGIFSFFKVILKCFPFSSLVVSDFDYLPDSTPGHGSPVVQTRFNGETINCSTLLLKKGLFDIFFPVNFSFARQMFSAMSGKEVYVLKHRQFIQTYADCTETMTRSGYNPMLEEFENMSFLLT